tara:strand:+ start:2092 stop:2385 length:294 start_codon:yes stop_codon:yes gene_type:complete
MKNNLKYYKENCEENYITTPISVLRYITELERELEKKSGELPIVDEPKVNQPLSLSSWMKEHHEELLSDYGIDWMEFENNENLLNDYGKYLKNFNKK